MLEVQFLLLLVWGIVVIQGGVYMVTGLCIAFKIRKSNTYKRLKAIKSEILNLYTRDEENCSFCMLPENQDKYTKLEQEEQYCINRIRRYRRCIDFRTIHLCFIFQLILLSCLGIASYYSEQNIVKYMEDILGYLSLASLVGYFFICLYDMEDGYNNFSEYKPITRRIAISPLFPTTL